MSITTVLVLLVVAVIAAAGTFVATYYWLQAREAGRAKQAQRDANTILEEARAQQKELTLQGKDEALRLRAEVDIELKERRAEVTRLERRLQQKEEAADKKVEQIERREKTALTRERELDTIRL